MKLVSTLTVIVVVPDSAAAPPLMVAEVALVVRHVRVARLLAPSVEVICAVGGVERRSTVVSLDAAP